MVRGINAIIMIYRQSAMVMLSRAEMSRMVVQVIDVSGALSRCNCRKVRGRSRGFVFVSVGLELGYGSCSVQQQVQR